MSRQCDAHRVHQGVLTTFYFPSLSLFLSGRLVADQFPWLRTPPPSSYTRRAAGEGGAGERLFGVEEGGGGKEKEHSSPPPSVEARASARGGRARRCWEGSYTCAGAGACQSVRIPGAGPECPRREAPGWPRLRTRGSGHPARGPTPCLPPPAAHSILVDEQGTLAPRVPLRPVPPGPGGVYEHQGGLGSRAQERGAYSWF